MKKYLLITAFIFLGMALSGCSNPSSNKNIVNNNQDESTKAEDALVSFFTYLSNQDFEKALLLLGLDELELDGSTNSWKSLENFSLPEDRSDKAKVLKRYCEAIGTCLKAKVIETKKETDDAYNLVVQFQNTDGSTFVLGPCCGATEEEMPPQDRFDFKVRKINNVFKVATPPIYVP